MFNRSAFGRVAFNRPFSTFVSASASADVIVEALAAAGIETSPVAAGDVIIEGTAAGLREIVGAHASADVIVEALAAAIRERFGSGVADVIVEARARARYTHLDALVFSGAFAPGDIVIIDAARLKITKNGENALHLVSGEPFDLNLGQNEITYTDPSGVRTVLMRITYKDKFV
ncbi:hypothetical protein D3C81_309280 [compost metagenome]